MKKLTAAVLCLAPAAWAGPSGPQFVYQGAAEIRKTGVEISAVEGKDVLQDDLQARLAKAKQELAKLIAALEKAANDETAGDKARLEHFKALAVAKAALSEIDAALAQSAAKPELESRIAEAQLLKNVIASFLGERGSFSAYKLKDAPFVVEVGADAAYERVAKRIPFLAGAIGGRLRINPRGGLRSQFNTLKAQFYGILLEAAHLDKSDDRLIGIAKWAKDIDVLEDDNFEHYGVITQRQYWDLKLKD
jgi:hypothetical protein